MPTQTAEIAGSWTKITRSACSQSYPDSIRIDERGLYFAENETPAIKVWDTGTFEVVGPEQVQISLANDALASYAFTLDGDVLTFTDAAGCRYSYRRSR